jgi:primosomal protein N' (replication factor Y) (superfamily II helicase)
MSRFVRIAVNVPSLAGVFDYSVPEGLPSGLKAGMLVVVPFGKQTLQGVVLEPVDHPAVSETKEIISLVDPEPVMTQAQIRLAEWIAERTLAPLAAAVGLFVPPGLAQLADVQYSINTEAPSAAGDKRSALGGERAAGELGPVQKRLMKLLQERGALRGRQIDHAMAKTEWRKAGQSLVKRGFLTTESVLPPRRVRPKFIRTAQLAVSPKAAEQAMATLGRKGAQSRREKALRYLVSRPEAINVSWVYAESGCSLTDLQELAEQQLILLQETEIWRDPLDRIVMLQERRAEISFSDEQQAVWERIDDGFREMEAGKPVKPFLLQGVTGSGKTEIYIRAASEAIERGKQAIVMVPEIALTPQTVQRFAARFPGQVGVMHSKLSDGERYDTWRRARGGLLKIIIGPRSALFAPLPNLGLIVLDECHDASYYQDELPFYNATTAAQAYASLARAVCILGSATPSVVQRHESEIGQSTRLEMKQRVGGGDGRAPAQELQMPPVQIVDLRQELQDGNRSLLSRELEVALKDVLARGEQAILFMNRRGTATYVFCRVCGHAVRCPRCDTPLTYHVATGERLLCHRCGHSQAMPRKCLQCGSLSMAAYGLGTEKVEAEVQRQFPEARTLRWDWETTREKDAHEVILGHFAAGRADVLIGTQMLAKGLDLPRVTLVGMILADVGLYLPDPFAPERVFQLLTQVAGRAGRTSRGGRAILQTYAPEHYVIRAAAMHDADGFYGEEAAQRRRLGYPPFSGLIRLEYRSYDAAKAQREASVLATRLQQRVQAEGRTSVNIIGPAPCFYTRLDGKYRWQIVLRGANLLTLLQEPPGHEWRIEVEPASLL